MLAGPKIQALTIERKCSRKLNRAEITDKLETVPEPETEHNADDEWD